jgi:uncharacterized membrane protein
MGAKILGIMFNAVVSVLTFAILFVAATLFFPVPIPAGLETPYKAAVVIAMFVVVYAYIKDFKGYK